MPARGLFFNPTNMMLSVFLFGHCGNKNNDGVFHASISTLYIFFRETCATIFHFSNFSLTFADSDFPAVFSE